MVTLGKVSLNIDFQENEAKPLLYGTLPLIVNNILTIIILLNSNYLQNSG